MEPDAPENASGLVDLLFSCGIQADKVSRKTDLLLEALKSSNNTEWLLTMGLISESLIIALVIGALIVTIRRIRDIEHEYLFGRKDDRPSISALLDAATRGRTHD